MTVCKILVPKYFKGLYFKVIISQIGLHKIYIHYYVWKSFHNDIFCLVKYSPWIKFTDFFFEILDEIFSIILKSNKWHQKSQYFVNNICLNTA